MTHRSFIRPLFLSGLAMVILGAGIYVGLGWAVWTGQPWLKRALGEKKFLRLYAAYATAAEVLSPGDRDGDGVSDGLETFLHMNADDPENGRLAIVLERPGTYVCDAREGYFDAPRGHESQDTIWLRPGEPMRIRGHTVYDYFPTIPYRAGCARGTRIELEPLDTPGIAYPGGKLTLPVNSDGAFEFGLQVPANVETDPVVQAAIRVRNAATGMELKLWNVDYVWPMPPLPATESKLVVEKWRGARWMSLRGDATTQLAWPPVPPNAEGLLLEVSRDEPGAKWFPVRSYPRDQRACPIYRFEADDLHPYKGPLRFRIVPVRFSPPETH